MEFKLILKFYLKYFFLGVTIQKKIITLTRVSYIITRVPFCIDEKLRDKKQFLKEVSILVVIGERK